VTEKVKLAKRTVDALAPPVKGTAIVWDSDLTGFGLRLSARGRRTYLIHGRTKAGRQVMMTLGVHGAITADQARDAAKRELGRLADGTDPVEEKQLVRAAEAKRLAMLTVAQLCDRYLEDYAQTHKRARSLKDDKAMIERFIKPRFGGVRVPDLEQSDIAALHREVGKSKPYTANRILALLSKMFSLAVAWKLRPDHPVKGIPRFQEEKRQRFLSSAELGRLAQALAEYPYRISASAIRMLLLTGARRGEVLGMAWEQVETEPGVWVKPSALTKQKTLHRVPLSAGARQLLEDMRRYRKPGEVYVFPGRGPGEHHLSEIKKAWAIVCKAAGITGVRIHDLRHTYASILASSGASLPLIGALLGHTQPSTTARYAHLADQPLQEATDKVLALLTALAENREAEVKPLRRR
jgi:integrase